MYKGHYGEYSGNAKHSRKLEMIHDRELISDAKKQLHHADQDYKHDSPARKESPHDAPSADNINYFKNKYKGKWLHPFRESEHASEKVKIDAAEKAKKAAKNQGSPAKHTDPKKIHVHSSSSYTEAPQKIMQNPDGSIVKEGKKPLRTVSKRETKSLSEEVTGKLQKAFKAIT
jgi:hypothetical protein